MHRKHKINYFEVDRPFAKLGLHRVIDTNEFTEEECGASAEQTLAKSYQGRLELRSDSHFAILCP